MKIIPIILALGLIALATILPVSAAGQGGNGKLMQNDFGSGEQFSGCSNPDCPQENCPNNQISPQDGTGNQYGKNLNGRTGE
jgi:hypothetical protein